MNPSANKADPREVRIHTNTVTLKGELALPIGSNGIVLFAHGSGSSRHSPRNHYVAEVLQRAGLGTLLMDLLTRREEIIDEQTRKLRFDIELLAQRLVGAVDWLAEQKDTGDMCLGCFGASTGAAAALVAAAQRPERVCAVVSRGGRPDLAGAALPHIRAPTLLIVGGNDPMVLSLNQEALMQLQGIKRLEIIPGATHLFREPGALERVAALAARWFLEYPRERNS